MSVNGDELLIGHLVPGTATDEQVQAYALLHSLDIIRDGGRVLDIDTFYKPGDADNWRAARDWWPTDAPLMLKLPDLGTMARCIGKHPPLEPMVFMDRLNELWSKICEWLDAEGRSRVHPNETPEQRRSRKGKEAQARYRARLSNGTDPERKAALEQVAALYEAYLETCRQRKAEKTRLDEQVHAALAAYESAKAAIA